MGVWEGLMDEMNKPGQSFGLGNGQNRSLAGLSPYNPPGVAILFVAAGQCAGVSPTPEVGGLSASPHCQTILALSY